MMTVGKSRYQFFLIDYEKLQEVVRQADRDGVSLTELLDQHIGTISR